MIEWQVCYAAWNIQMTDELDDCGWAKTIPSNTDLDNRTIRVKTFETEEDAVFYAEHYLKSRDEQDLKWLAYLEIKKCEIEVIRKLK